MVRKYKPREWSYTAIANRDDAAEEIAAALRQVVPLVDHQQDPQDLRCMSRIIYHLQNALRHLEKSGAQTRPGEL